MNNYKKHPSPALTTLCKPDFNGDLCVDVPRDLFDKDSELYKQLFNNFKQFCGSNQLKQLPLLTQTLKYKIEVLEKKILPAIAKIYGGYGNFVEVFGKTSLWIEMINTFSETHM